MQEQNLQKASQFLELTDKEIELGMSVFNVNQLVAYPLSDLQISDWARSINRLKPDLTVDELNGVIDLFILGELEWDTRKGIQNIFTALSRPLGYSPEETN